MAASMSPAEIKRMKIYVIELEEALNSVAKVYEEKIKKLEQKAQHFEEVWSRCGRMLSMASKNGRQFRKK